MPARLAAVTLTWAAAAGLVMPSWIVTSLHQHRPAADSQPDVRYQPDLPFSATQPSPAVARLQAAAWYGLGGRELIRGIALAPGFSSAISQLATALKAEPTSAALRTASGPLASVCDGVGATVTRARAYFPVPIPAAQQAWARALTQADRASADCQRALGRASFPQLADALGEVKDAQESMILFFSELSKIIRA